MIEVPIDYIKPGDVLAKHHTFKNFLGGMSSSVDLMKGYKLTDKVLTKLKSEFKVQCLAIEDKSPDFKEVELDQGFEEIERQKIVDTYVHNMNQIKSSGIIDIKAIGSMVENIIENVFRVIKKGTGSFRTLTKAFTSVQSHDVYTWEHSVNTAIYAAIIAFSTPETFSEQKTVYKIGRFTRNEILVFNMLLHDVGKIKIPLGILNKQGKLTPEEIEIIKKHPYQGFVYLRKINEKLKEKNLPLIPANFKVACLYHHQAYNGSGYPALRIGTDVIRPYKGTEIPIIGRIAAVVDIYDAITSSRPYALPLFPAEALKVLKKEEGNKLDPDITEAFIKNIEPFPKGSTVILTTGELAVVVGYANENKFNPIVKPYMKKILKEGKEVIIRLPYRDNIEILPDSKVQIVINKDIYRASDERKNQISGDLSPNK